MVNKQEFENYKAELEMLVGIKITKAIAKFNESISVTSENNEVDIIQRLTNENWTLQNRVGQLENRVYLLEKTLIDSEIKLNNANQYNRRNNIKIQSISQSVKPKDLEGKVRSSHLRCSAWKGVLTDFANFTAKYLFWSLFLVQLQAFRPANF